MRCAAVFLALAVPLWGADLAKQLAAAAKSTDEAHLCALLARARPDAPKATVQIMLQIGVEHPSAKVYETVRTAMAALRGKEALDTLAKALAQQKDPRVRKLAMFALGDIPEEPTVAPLVACLKDKDPGIALEAARLLGGKRHRDAAGGLVEALAFADKASAELSVAVRLALFKLTGQSMRTPEDWTKWWSREKELWEPGRYEGAGRTTTKFTPPVMLPRFFGIEIFSVRVVFVIDISESMLEPARGYKSSRVELVKRELVKTLRSLSPETRFTVIAFNNKIKSMWPQMYPAVPQNVEKAVTWVEALVPEGTTWTQEALEAAFAVKEANALVLLSDGSPCKGKGLLPVQPILDWVERANRFRKMTVHTIGFPEAFVPFLRALAGRNGGTYQHARPDQKPTGELPGTAPEPAEGQPAPEEPPAAEPRPGDTPVPDPQPAEPDSGKSVEVVPGQ